MAEIEFSNEEKSLLAHKLKQYCAKELDHEIGQFEAEFFLDFISAEIGGHYYNRGLADAQAVIATKFEDINDALYEIEAPVNMLGRG